MGMTVFRHGVRIGDQPARVAGLEAGRASIRAEAG